TATDSYSGLAGTLTANTIGASISVEREFLLFWIVGLDLSAGYKYAKVDKMTASYSGGTMAFYKNSTGWIGLVDNSQIGTGGFQYGSIDFSGFNVGFGLEFDL
ncbi:MAG TPA: hypothetical protein VJ873_13710, partial [bacterium]|nr:hypothetical protein [bacterium]